MSRTFDVSKNTGSNVSNNLPSVINNSRCHQKHSTSPINPEVIKNTPSVSNNFQCQQYPRVPGITPNVSNKQQVMSMASVSDISNKPPASATIFDVISDPQRQHVVPLATSVSTITPGVSNNPRCKQHSASATIPDVSITPDVPRVNKKHSTSIATSLAIILDRNSTTIEFGMWRRG